MASDNFRYRYGETEPHICPIAQAQQVNIGDLVAQSGGLIVRAEDQSWTGTLAGTQQNFVAAFMGVSGQRKNSGSTQPGTGGGQPFGVRIDTAGVFEFDCVSATFNVGDLVGPAKDTGNALLSQTVVAVGNKNLAIGRVAETSISTATGSLVAITKVKVRVFSFVMEAIIN